MSKLQPRAPLDEVARILNSLGHRHRIDQVFFDWVEMMALAMSNAVDKRQFAAREARYMVIVGGYSKEEAILMAEMYAHLVLAFERIDDSPFHELVSRLELHSAGSRKRLGQYFTPYTVSVMMAKMALAPKDKLLEQIRRKGFVTMMEPACGAGGMILAFARAMLEEGINYQQHLHVRAVDIDPTCVHMTYVVAALAGIPAIVSRGNSLHSDQPTEHWFTPFHVAFDWNTRLAAADALEQVKDLLPQLEAMPPPAIGPIGLDERLVEQVSPVAAETPVPHLPDKPVSRPGLANWKIIPAPGSIFPR